MPEPINPTDALLQSFARALDESLTSRTGKRHGFVLLVFDPDKPEAHYVSNSDRAECIEALKGLLGRLHVPLAPPPPGTDPANN